MTPSTDQEAATLTFYLTNKAPTTKVVVLYDQALQQTPVETDQKQQKLWAFCMKHTWALGFIDAGLALTVPYHPIRKRLFIMLAILETQPAYNSYFLPRKRSKLHVFNIAFLMMNAVLKVVVGKFLIWFI